MFLQHLVDVHLRAMVDGFHEMVMHVLLTADNMCWYQSLMIAGAFYSPHVNQLFIKMQSMN